MGLYVVRRERGGPWDWSRDLRRQVGWDEHARFMDDLVDQGFIVLGGPLEGEREVLHVVEAESRDAIHERLAADPWTANGMLRTVRVEQWTILLDGRGKR
ncbi:MAG TPA: YciI family protein [Terriglobales bacterium]|nr:YciI family protein [Terriglobales bacterium]